MELHCKVCGKESYTMERGTTNIICSEECQFLLKIKQWKTKRLELGDRNMQEMDYILLQRTFDGGIIIQVIGVREEMRRKGIATRMIKMVESLGAKYVILQSIMDDDMLKLAKKLGYKQKLPGSMDFIKE